MTETISQAPVAPASAVPASTPVVVASVHKSIVASLEGELEIAYLDLQDAWKTHNVIVVAIVAFIAGVIVRSVI